MPVTPNILLQATARSKAKAASANPPAPVADPGEKASGFAHVYANQARNTPSAVNERPVKPMRDNVAQGPVKQDVSRDNAAAAKPAVADSGKSLPADKPAADDKIASEGSDAAGTSVTEAAVDPTTDPAEPALVAQTPPRIDAVPPQGEQPIVVAMAAAAVTADAGFDPQADPLDALPALRMAMEQSGHVSASSQAQPPALPTSAEADGEPASAQNLGAGLTSRLDVQAEKDSAEGGGKAFSGLLDDGLKDLKSAASDTRVDDFANRLAALTQAATPKTANALPVNQPIALHQSGWTEEVVNRVMYLSSANLKAADIQLQPAELGRLDIRVNMVPDQQTQVTFMSAHPGVREALDGQMHRLREMFAQQGMGQVDVNVSDQSRGWQGQGQEQARQGEGDRTGSRGGRLDAMNDESAPTVAEVAASATSIIGSSAVDYYA